MRIIRNKKLSEHSPAAVPSYVVSIIGAGCVGKSSMIERFMDEKFTAEYEPTISEVYSVPLKRNGRTVASLLLHDTAGSIEFPAMRRLVISKSHVCMILYSVDSAKSLERAEKYMEEVISVARKGFPCILVGTKNDVNEREVSFEKGLRFAVKYGCSYIEISSKDDVNIKDAFDTVVSKIEYLESHRNRCCRNSDIVGNSWRRFSVSTLLRI